MKSDRIMLLASEIGILPLTLAQRLPSRVLRFVGLLIALPLTLLCLFLSAPVILVGLVVMVWELAQ